MEKHRRLETISQYQMDKRNQRKHEILTLVGGAALIPYGCCIMWGLIGFQAPGQPDPFVVEIIGYVTFGAIAAYLPVWLAAAAWSKSLVQDGETTKAVRIAKFPLIYLTVVLLLWLIGGLLVSIIVA